MSIGQDSKMGSKKEPAKTKEAKRQLKETKKRKRNTPKFSINNRVQYCNKNSLRENCELPDEYF